jgi:protease-4
MSFFKHVFATIIGIFLFIIIILVFIMVLIPKEKEIEGNSVLKLDLNKHIVEREEGSLLDALQPALGAEEGVLGLLELKRTILKAKDDPKIKGIILDSREIDAGFAMLEEIRKVLLDFKSSGKFLIAYSENYSEGSYYLASVADKIYLPESGLVELNGLSVELLFFKGTLDKLKIQPEIFPVGKYKSAVEPFRYEKMSEENRLQIRSFLRSVYDQYISSVATSRNLDESLLRKISDSMLVRNSADALKYKLITDVGYYDQMLDHLRGILSLSSEEKVNIISIDKYQDKTSEPDMTVAGINKVAVIFASGDIHQGRGSKNSIGSESLAAEIMKARMDDDVKAVVIRINSPGGSALASDIIWREIYITAQKKPVIASMSDVAASGGYYIAAACDSIVAHPTTITGSIGVFGILFNGKEFLREKLGITADREKTGIYSDIGSFTREMTDAERKFIRKEVERIYSEFKQKVAQGRNMDTTTVELYAQGRVWTGIEAKEKGLVDILGGLEDAIAIAAVKAGLGENYQVEYLPEIKPVLLKELLEGMGESSVGISEDIKKYRPYLELLLQIERMEGIQARMPFEILFR